MAPPCQIRRSRRLSHKSPMEVADYDWQGAHPLPLLHGGPDGEITSPSPSTATSSASPPSIVTHLPFTPGSSHTRNRKQGHIPRPPNAFMVFRSWLWNKDNLKSIERDNRNVSRIAGRYWNELTEAERAPFRSMAEEAKARHAQLYPEYRYSPGSQKKPKVFQRRSQRSVDAENEKCKKVADLLLGGVAGPDLAKYLGEGPKKVKREEQDAFPTVPDPAHSSPLLRNTLKRPATPCVDIPRQQRTKRQRTLPPPAPISSHPSEHAITLPVLPFEDVFDNTPTPRALTRTPEPVYAPDEVDGFVPTDDIPYLSLDNCNDPTIKRGADDGFFSLRPSHLHPGVHSVFAGVKPEASSFVDSCVLGAYTTNVQALPAPVPLTDFDINSYASMDVGLVPLGSPVFSNPFEPSTPTAGHAELLDTLDQLFGQPISPFTLPREIW